MLPGKARHLSGLRRTGPGHRGLPLQGRRRRSSHDARPQANPAGGRPIARMPFCFRKCCCGAPRGSSTSAWTSSLRETLERIEREGFDAVLLDLSLPDSHGLDTIRRLCTRRAGDADSRDHGPDGRAHRRRGRPLRRGGLPGQGADRRPLDGAGDPLCHRPQAGRGGVEGGEGTPPSRPRPPPSRPTAPRTISWRS